MANTLVIAAAGSGKTTLLIHKALAIKNQNVLITTYTEANSEEIRRKIVSINKYIPSNIYISTWFSLLIRHGVKPYRNFLFDFKIKGMQLVSKQSGIRFYRKGIPITFSEDTDFEKHYFTNSRKVYSDKLAKLVVKLNDVSGGKVFARLTAIYPNIFIDEAQDLAGYDLEIIRILAINAADLNLSCDPRQVTYLTHNPKKFKKYSDGRIKDFLQEECKGIDFFIDEKTLAKSHRCNSRICDFSNVLYPEVQPSESNQKVVTGHDGIFLVNPNQIDKYLEEFSPTQLRWNINEPRSRKNYPVLNFGQAKGLTFDRILIYPTQSMKNWVVNPNSNLKNTTRAKFYVAITRAKFSAAIVVDKFDTELHRSVEWYS